MARPRKYKPRTLYLSKEMEKKLAPLGDYPLSIIEAPSGFGKTTALKHFFNGAAFDTIPVYWLTFLGEPLPRFWSAFCNVLAQIDAETAAALAGLKNPCDEDIPWIIQCLSKIHCPSETYIILDNFSELKLKGMDTWLHALSYQGGTGLHIVAVTTQVAGISYAAAENNLIYRLFASDFTFSAADTAAYYQAVGLRLSPEELEEVHRRADGWAAALYLQMLSYLENGYFDKAGIESLLEHSLWRHLEPPMQCFYLALSIFPRFTQAQAAYITGFSPEDAAALLQSNGFVHFDRQKQVYYFHAIFADSLSQRFAALPEEQRRAIYLQGGRWAKLAGDPLQALGFYYQAGAFEELFAMVSTSYELTDIIDETTEPMILDMLENTPREIKLRHPRALIPLALTLFFLGRNDILLSSREEIEGIFHESPVSQGEKRALRGEWELLLSFLEYNRIAAMSARHRRAWELLEGPVQLINPKSTWTFGSPSVLYLFWRERGALEEELGQMEACMPLYFRLTNGHGTGAPAMMAAEAALMQGALEQAEILAHQAMFAADSKGQNSIYQCGLFLLARLAVLRGDSPLLESSLTALTESARHNTEDICRYTLDLARGFLGLLLGKADMVAPWLAEGEIERRLVPMTIPFAQMIYGRILLEQGAYPKLLGAGAYFLEQAAFFPNLLPQVYTLIYMAAAQEHLGNTQAGLELLNQALALALPDRIYLPFAENSAPLAPLMGYPLAAEEADLAAIAVLSRQMEAARAVFAPPAAGLTPREREIALLARERRSSKSIAQQLHLSESTVKNTLSRVYEKLDIHSREALMKIHF